MTIDPKHESILRACFQAGAAINGLREDALDETSRRLLPLLAARRPDCAGDLAPSLRLAAWAANQRRIATTASLIDTLGSAGIECLLLKGMAVLLGYYRDAGLRPMGDIDLLVQPADVERSAEALWRAGWLAEEGVRSAADLRSRMRVRHGWQFDREGPQGSEESCDLHWHPVVRCYEPAVGERLWRTRAPATLSGRAVWIPGPAEQLFHACAHGLQWSWTPPVRWIADAMLILENAGEALDWQAVLELARAGRMRVRMHRALDYLRRGMGAAVIPEGVLESLSGDGAEWRWERNEHELLQRECPLDVRGSLRWHLTHFQRIRPFDSDWARLPFPIGFAEYLRLFVNVRKWRELAAALWRESRHRGTLRTDFPYEDV